MIIILLIILVFSFILLYRDPCGDCASLNAFLFTISALFLVIMGIYTSVGSLQADFYNKELGTDYTASEIFFNERFIRERHYKKGDIATSRNAIKLEINK